MSVEDWARREAEKRFPDGWSDDETRVRLAREGTQYGIVRAFDALLSDETIRAVAESEHEVNNSWARFGPLSNMSDEYQEKFLARARAALEAAVRAVTDPKTHDSSTTTTGEQ